MGMQWRELEKLSEAKACRYCRKHCGLRVAGKNILTKRFLDRGVIARQADRNLRAGSLESTLPMRSSNLCAAGSGDSFPANPNVCAIADDAQCGKNLIWQPRLGTSLTHINPLGESRLNGQNKIRAKIRSCAIQRSEIIDY